MSAAEKLKALGDEHTRALREDTGTLKPYLLYDALPEILAVVEAAANAHAVYAVSGQCEATTQQSLRAALAALDETLTTKGEQ